MRGALTFAAVALTCLTIYTQGAPSPNGTLINWETCTDNELIQCGFYTVPLDYTDASAGNATLAVSRYKSTNSTRLGTLFTNPGGPGGSGTQLIQGGLGQLISELTQGQYDVVSWDPRGVNLSTPAITCGFETVDDVNNFFHSVPLTIGVEARGNFTNQDDIDNLFNQLNETDADLVAFGQKCNESDGAFLKFMGTTSVVRDMVSLSDYLEGPGQKLNYWGFSYGTVIGNYFVNMFPDRVGRLILDGVVDTNVWATQPSLKVWGSSLGSTEDTFLGFATTCAQAGPQGCALAQQNSTGASIVQFVRDLIDTAFELGQKNIQNISSSTMRSELFNEGNPGLFQPSTWVDLALLLAANATQFSNLTAASGSPPQRRLRTRDSAPFSNATSPVNAALSLFVITCLDSIDQDNVTTKDVFDELLRVTHEESPTFGELMPHDASFYCHRFPARSIERLTGPFNNTPANPIVVIGNQADPITPFANAQSVAAQYGDHARLIEQNDFGHSSVAERSDCTRGVITDYFLTGALPTEGELCGTNQVLFPGPGITKNTMDAAASASANSQTNVGTNPPTPNTNVPNSKTDVASNVEGALGTDNSADSDNVHNLTMERNILAGVAGALALASLVLAGSLIFACMRNRRTTRYASPMAASARVTRHDGFDGRKSLDGEERYSDPWEGGKTEY